MSSNDPFGWYKTEWYQVRDHTSNGLKLNYMWHLRQTYRVTRYAGAVWFAFELFYQLKLRDGTITDSVKFYQEYEKDKSYGRKERLPPGTTFDDLKKINTAAAGSATSLPASGPTSSHPLQQGPMTDLFNQPMPNPMTPVVLFTLHVYDDYVKENWRFVRFTTIMWWRGFRNTFTDFRNQIFTNIDELCDNNAYVTQITAHCRKKRRDIVTFEEFRKVEEDTRRAHRSRFDEFRGAGSKSEKGANTGTDAETAAVSGLSVVDQIGRLERELKELKERVGGSNR